MCNSEPVHKSAYVKIVASVDIANIFLLHSFYPNLTVWRTNNVKGQKACFSLPRNSPTLAQLFLSRCVGQVTETVFSSMQQWRNTRIPMILKHIFISRFILDSLSINYVVALNDWTSFIFCKLIMKLLIKDCDCQTATPHPSFHHKLSPASSSRPSPHSL